MSEATERPWRLCGGYTPQFKAIAGRNGYIVFRMAHSDILENGKPITVPEMHEQRANAELIVRAVNSHDALVEACRAVGNILAQNKVMGIAREEDHYMLELADKALKLAKGKTR